MNVNLHEEKCKDALDGLVTRSLSLISLSNKVIQDAEFREDDHLGFMGLCFLSRQIDHLQCMVMLTHHRDAMLIARSMLEGLCMVKWAQLSSHERPLEWRTFGYVYNWRIPCLKVASGESVDPVQQEKIKSALAEYGHYFYTVEARTAHGEGRELPKTHIIRIGNAELKLSRYASLSEVVIFTERFIRPFRTGIIGGSQRWQKACRFQKIRFYIHLLLHPSLRWHWLLAFNV